MNRVIVAGGRDFDDYDRLEIACDRWITGSPADTIIIVGISEEEYKRKVAASLYKKTMKGADYNAYSYAEKRGYPIKHFPANWDLYKRAAGPIRNREMAKFAAPAGSLIAFWDRRSAGTHDMIEYALHYGLKIHVEYY